MNVQLKDITVTARDGRVSHLDQVYIRGSHVRYFIVPDMLRFVRVSIVCRSCLWIEEGTLWTGGRMGRGGEGEEERKGLG